jgi:hypothetical protein
MNLSLLLMCLWVVLSFVLAAIPSTDNHWRRAYVLIALGIPLLIFMTWQGGLLFGFVGLLVGCSVLRWPVIFLWRWVRGKLEKSS